MKQIKKRVFTIIALLLAFCLVGGGLYVNDYYHGTEEAKEALISDEKVTVKEMEDGSYSFLPEQADTGIIFYPGGKVEHIAYAPLMKALAKEGVACILLEMPLRLAVLDMDGAKGVKEQYPEIEKWYLAGHSLGGSMAASYIAEQEGKYDGLILLAAYSTADLYDSEIDVLSILGTEDRVLNREKYEEYKSNLPEAVTEILLEGGNHAAFGNYGKQDGDGELLIGAREQREETVKAILEMLKNTANDME